MRSLFFTAIAFAIASIIPILGFIFVADLYGNDKWDLVCKFIKIAFVFLGISATITAVLVLFAVLGVK